MNFLLSVGFDGGEVVVETLVVVLRTAEMERELDLIQRRREEEEEEDDLLGFRAKGRVNLEIGNGDLEEEGFVEKEIDDDDVVAAAMVQENDEAREREKEETCVNLNRLKNETWCLRVLL